MSRNSRQVWITLLSLPIYRIPVPLSWNRRHKRGGRGRGKGDKQGTYERAWICWHGLTWLKMAAHEPSLPTHTFALPFPRPTLTSFAHGMAPTIVTTPPVPRDPTWGDLRRSAMGFSEASEAALLSSVFPARWNCPHCHLAANGEGNRKREERGDSALWRISVSRSVYVSGD